MKKRLAAEWEPAIGVMVAWPPAVPRALMEAYMDDSTLYLLVSGEEAERQARATLERWGRDADAVKYLQVPQGEDFSWPRDWGPQPLFDEQGGYRLVGPTYMLSTPFCDIGHDVELMCAAEEPHPLSEYEGDALDNQAAGAIAEQLGVGFVKAPFAFTGGNVLNDGVNSILSTEVLLFENRFRGLGDDEYFGQVAELTGMSNYTVLSDYEMFSLNHIDCLAKPLDDRRILVLRYPEGHPHRQLVEDIVENELGTALNSYGQPWEIVRLDTDYIHRDGMVAAYANSLILNKTVYVPLYSIPQDEIALAQWAEAMPGYAVKGFEFKLDAEPDCQDLRGIYEYLGWDAGDVLHCRSRAVWDPGMLYVRASRPFGDVRAGEGYRVHATVVSYSGASLEEGMPRLHYRESGREDWTVLAMRPGSTHEDWIADIPGAAAGSGIEYFVEAADASGRRECAPRVAPDGFYAYAIA